jgi:hypothetical protein
MRIIFVFLAMLVAGTVVAFGQDPAPQVNPGTKTPIVNERQRNQHNRIKQGVKSGELTRKEAAKLRNEEKTIQAEKQMAKADGKVTPAERAKIRRDQNRANRDIYRKKHNERTQVNPQGDPK